MKFLNSSIIFVLKVYYNKAINPTKNAQRFCREYEIVVNSRCLTQAICRLFFAGYRHRYASNDIEINLHYLFVCIY